MTKTEESEIALDRIQSAIDAQARDDGHVPVWEITADGDDLTASARCSRCGLDAAIRVRTDGSSWKGGKLRLSACT